MGDNPSGPPVNPFPPKDPPPQPAAEEVPAFPIDKPLPEDLAETE